MSFYMLRRYNMNHKALYPGSFDPITFGHMDIIERASKLVDELYVAVLVNSGKVSLFSIDERVNMLQELYGNQSNIKIVSFDGLLVDFAKQLNVPTIVRGLRAVTDFEYELQISQTNRVVCSDVDTIFLTTSLQYAYLSSTIVKEVAFYGGDISSFVPKTVADKTYKKYNKENRGESYDQ